MVEDRTGLILPKRQKRHKRLLAHFSVHARINSSRPMRASVTIDRAPGAMVTIRKWHSRRTWQLSLASLVEVALAKLMREEAERQLGVR